ncbi:class I SAM-dependent methyltransferase, partial [Acidithiobacillus sp.]|uniref:class I SAM-dependent methyltransferase n=1 Tax=Acidithiobacillus sp. TaxID=1872118 RepID=UPI003D0004E2
MAHVQQRRFCEIIKSRYPQYFRSSFVLDIGSLDINGNNLYLFDASSLYLGVDIASGKNVDIIASANELQLPDCTFDVVISTECLEHDRYWSDTLSNALRMLRPGGLLLVTCATTGRPEHGTRRTTPEDAPLLGLVDDARADYYQNLTEADFRNALDITACFSYSEFVIGEETHDLYFFGIKNGTFEKRIDRSHQITSHPVFIQMHNHENHILDLNATLSERDAALSNAKFEIEALNDSINCLRKDLACAISERDAANAALQSIQKSRSWIITKPLRASSNMIRSSRLWEYCGRAKNILWRKSIRSFFSPSTKSPIARDGSFFGEKMAQMRWAVMCTPHTLFVAHLLSDRLRYHGFSVDIITKSLHEEGFPHDMYIVIAAQIFRHLPPAEKRIIYQMEQSTSNRWFN